MMASTAALGQLPGTGFVWPPDAERQMPKTMRRVRMCHFRRPHRAGHLLRCGSVPVSVEGAARLQRV